MLVCFSGFCNPMKHEYCNQWWRGLLWNHDIVLQRLSSVLLHDVSPGKVQTWRALSKGPDFSLRSRGRFHPTSEVEHQLKHVIWTWWTELPIVRLDVRRPSYWQTMQEDAIRINKIILQSYKALPAYLYYILFLSFSIFFLPPMSHAMLCDAWKLHKCVLFASANLGICRRCFRLRRGGTSVFEGSNVFWCILEVLGHASRVLKGYSKNYAGGGSVMMLVVNRFFSLALGKLKICWSESLSKPPGELMHFVIPFCSCHVSHGFPP